MIIPEWPAPARVRALVTTRAEGDMAAEEGRRRLRELLPAEPRWLRQVHGIAVVEDPQGTVAADAAISRQKNSVCAVLVADCMPVLLADDSASAVAVAHAGWRGLSGGVIEATLEAMARPAQHVLAWLGPAIGPRAYEVGAEVREAFLERDAGAASAFAAREGRWLLDLYAVARQRLAAQGVTRVFGGGLCTYSDPGRFYSHRRSRDTARMAAAIWLT
jgi:YfiH family protein